MPRQNRPLQPGGWYHVTNRGVDRMDIFRSNSDRVRFLELIAEAIALHGIEVHAFCLLLNHYHLLIRTPDANLDAAMHRAMSIYAREFNVRHERDGPLFKARYHSCLIETDEYLKAVSRYIHRNPLDIGVQDLVRYRWSSFGTYVSPRKSPLWLSTEFTLEQFGTRRDYQRMVEMPFQTDVDRLLRSDTPPSRLGPDSAPDDQAA